MLPIGTVMAELTAALEARYGVKGAIGMLRSPEEADEATKRATAKVLIKRANDG